MPVNHVVPVGGGGGQAVLTARLRGQGVVPSSLLLQPSLLLPSALLPANGYISLKYNFSPFFIQIFNFLLFLVKTGRTFNNIPLFSINFPLFFNFFFFFFSVFSTPYPKEQGPSQKYINPFLCGPPWPPSPSLGRPSPSEPRGRERAQSRSIGQNIKYIYI